MTVLFLHATDDPAPQAIRELGSRVAILRAGTLGEALGWARGLVTTMHADQETLLALRPALTAFLARGGRWVFNGHVVRPMLAGLGRFVPLVRPSRADLALTALAPHPVFADIPISDLEANRGVAGFYGRGHNPPMANAIAITGLGPDHVPVDWVAPVGQGRLFCHAGNDLGGAGIEQGHAPLLWRRLVDWAAGGPCL